MSASASTTHTLHYYDPLSTENASTVVVLSDGSCLELRRGTITWPNFPKNNLRKTWASEVEWRASLVHSLSPPDNVPKSAIELSVPPQPPIVQLPSKHDALLAEVTAHAATPYSKASADALCNYYAFLLTAHGQEYVRSSCIGQSVIAKAQATLNHPATTIPCWRIINTVIDMFK